MPEQSSNGSPPNMLKALKVKHREIARLSFEGFGPSDIQAKTGINLQSVYKILNDPICQSYINGLGDQVDKASLSVRERLMKLNANALEAFEDILSKDSKAPYSVQASVGKDILDRTGHAAPKEANVNLTLQGKSDDEIDAQIAMLKSQLDSTYNADLTADASDGEDGEDLTEAEAAELAEEAKINPITDCKE